MCIHVYGDILEKTQLFTAELFIAAALTSEPEHPKDDCHSQGCEGRNNVECVPLPDKRL